MNTLTHFHRGSSRTAAVTCRNPWRGVGLALWVLALRVPAADPAPTVVVDPAAQYQTLEGWGTSLCWWANVVGGWGEAPRQSVADLLFDERQGLGLNIVRYNIGGGDTAGHAHLRAGGDVPGFRPAADAPYDWSSDANQRWMLTAARARGANLLEAFSNSPPWWLTQSGCSAGARNPRRNNLRDDAYEAFAAYLADVVRQFRDAWGIEFRTLDPCNEPDGTWWEAGKGQEGCRFDEAGQSRILKALAAALQERGLSTEISAIDAHGIDAAISQFQAWDADARKAVSQLNTHAYRGTPRPELRNLAAQHGKRLWMSEYDGGSNPDGGPGHDHDSMIPALDLAAAIIRDLRDLQPQAWVLWQAVENEQYCVWWKYNYGLLHGDFMHGTEAIQVTRKYHAMAQFTRFVRPGYRMIGVLAEDTVAFLDPRGSRLVLVTANASAAPRPRRYDLSAFSGLGATTVTAYRTTVSEAVNRLPDPVATAAEIVAEEPAQSITTYVVDGVTYAGPLKLNDTVQGTAGNRFEYSGEWSFKGGEPAAFTGDNHWSGRRDDAYRVYFHGTGIRLYASRDPNHGIAALRLDDGDEQRLDLYAPRRADQVLVYSSPVLPRGDHVLTVRVTGDKAAAARHVVVPADRADIIP
jgi:O-glycosyl hydrolase